MTDICDLFAIIEHDGLKTVQKEHMFGELYASIGKSQDVL